jgi:hypothetical protein
MNTCALNDTVCKENSTKHIILDKTKIGSLPPHNDVNSLSWSKNAARKESQQGITT